MRRRHTFFGILLLASGVAVWRFWRSKRARLRAQSFLRQARDRIRQAVDRLQQKNKHSDDSQASKPAITGLAPPECRPLTTVADFLAWSPASDPDAPFCQTYNSPLMLPPPRHALGGALPRAPPQPPGARPAAAPHAPPPAAAAAAAAADAPAPAPAAAAPAPAPQLLVCHDMMGGYLADRLVQGADQPGFFRLWQWDQVDAFIYFSHHLITIPPPAWTAAAHRNGARVLGTFITEWAEGRERCTSLFASPASARAAADQLVALALHHGFDGWLVNIENTLDRSLIPNLMHFVAHLRVRMAAQVAWPLVVWYDAITTEGRLEWQDGLTPLNAPFFDAADALFVNYKWQEGAPAAVAAEAGSRADSVYMGVDVFGRGSYGGGQNNCPVALAAARAAGVSAALFAPGWVYENFDTVDFEQRQEAFWKAIRDVWPSRPALLQRLPLGTCFNTGSGRAVWLGGRRVSCAPWWQLAAQDVVPHTTQLAAGGGSAAAAAAAAAGPRGASAPRVLSVRHTQQLAFCGGSCLALTTVPATTTAASSSSSSSGPAPSAGVRPPGPWLHPLYTACVPVPAAGLALSYTAACSGSSRVAVLLTCGGAGGGGAAGVAVGPWTKGDQAVVEALASAGYTCVCANTAPTGATTSPLPDPPAPASSAAVSSRSAPSSLPAGLPWLACSVHLPRALLPPGAASVTAVGLVCYTSPAPAAPTAAAGPASRAGAAGAAAAAAAAAGQDGSGFQAFLGRLSLSEHGCPCSPAASTASSPMAPGVAASAAAAAAPAATLAVGARELPVAAPLLQAGALGRLLAGGRCTRSRWGRPGRGGVQAQRELSPRGSEAAARVPPELTDFFTSSVTGGGGGGRADPRAVDTDDSWEQSSAAGGNGGSAVAAAAGGGGGGLHEPPVVLGGSDVGSDDGDGEGVDVAAAASAADRARLLTCEVVWEPQFDEGGMPLHRSYHVWVHFTGSGGAASGALLSPTAAAPGRAGLGGAAVLVGPASPGPASGGGGHPDAWEVLPRDYTGAVWVGEAFVAAYRLVDLEVPAWAAGVTVLVQGMGAAGELQPLQPLASLPVPPAPQQQ